VKDIIDDSINGSRKVLKDSIKLIEKYTRKSNWEKIEKY
jgi:UDP-N-acetylmuramyl pentapeptide synthase